MDELINYFYFEGIQTDFLSDMWRNCGQEHCPRARAGNNE